MKIYTKTGDTGETSLFGGARVGKEHLRIEAYGTVDELNAFIAQLMTNIDDSTQSLLLIEVQRRLFTIGSILAADPNKELPVPDIRESDILELENAMDNMDQSLPQLTSFILPGGSVANSCAHICRTVTRRAERRVVALHRTDDVPEIVIRYLNRLSDYFFVLSRYLAATIGHEETPWRPRK